MSRRISHRAQKLWDKLASWYGARIAEQYGANPPEDWAELFDRTDPDDIASALIDARRLSPIHPPTLGQVEAAIPRKQRTGPGEKSKPEKIAELMLAKHGKDLCPHQCARPWNYFGPMTTFELLPKRVPPQYVTHPDPRGVQVPPCEACGKPSFRVTLDQALVAA